MPDPIVDAALARGALIVTPNKRLAREIAARHDRRQVAAGRTTWPAPRVLPWMTFVRELVQVGQDAGLALPAFYLDEAQAGHLWQRVVRNALFDQPLVDADAAAALAAQAWEIAYGWGTGLDGWRGLGGTDDIDAFVRWAAAYANACGRLDAVDATRAADVLVAVAAKLPGVAALDVVLTGFIETSPQQHRLLQALEAGGAAITKPRPDNRTIASSPARLVACQTSRDELASAFDWARAQALHDPQARVAVVVLDLADRLSGVRAACEERLCAPLQWPGRHDEPRPYEISLGGALADVPLVASALALVELAERALPRPDVAVLVRSPYLPGQASHWLRRAALEWTWLDRGTRELSWPALVDDLASVDQNLAARWRWASGELPRVDRLTPRAWVERWRGWLTDVAWCDGRTLSSHEYQADGAWNELLGAFARLTPVASTLGAADALATLRHFARTQVFQPESTGARIKVLGMLEASGLAFDALWIAGMGADAWPRSPDPNPLLPLSWQRERGVPRASPERELAFARSVTTQLAHAARDVVFSYAAIADDFRRTNSPLLAGLPSMPPQRPVATTAERQFAQRPVLDSIADAAAPPIAPGTRLPGGTGMLELQSACPFRAVAAYRLRAERWPLAPLGLTPIERGKLVHATLDAFWRTMRTQTQLAATDEATLARSIDVAFEQARAVLAPARWATLPSAVAASEVTCVVRLVTQWLVEFERQRPAFTVLDTERRATVTLAGYALDLRIDRIDSLDAGGVAVIDYKSGYASAPARWFEPRPQGMQAALYARASEQANPDVPVRALVYAQLRPGELKPVGLAADPLVWPGLSAPGDVKGVELEDWNDATGRLQASLESVARAFGAGAAAIDPKDRKSGCAICRLHALCRIGTSSDDGTAALEADDDDGHSR